MINDLKTQSKERNSRNGEGVGLFQLPSRKEQGELKVQQDTLNKVEAVMGEPSRQASQTRYPISLFTKLSESPAPNSALRPDKADKNFKSEKQEKNRQVGEPNLGPIAHIREKIEKRPLAQLSTSKASPAPTAMKSLPSSSSKCLPMTTLHPPTKENSSPLPMHLSHSQKLKPLRFTDGVLERFTFDHKDEDSLACREQVSQAKSMDHERKELLATVNRAKRASLHVRRALDDPMPAEEQKAIQGIRRPARHATHAFDSPFGCPSRLPTEKERREALPMREGILGMIGGLR